MGLNRRDVLWLTAFTDLRAISFTYRQDIFADGNCAPLLRVAAQGYPLNRIDALALKWLYEAIQWEANVPDCL